MANVINIITPKERIDSVLDILGDSVVEIEKPLWDDGCYLVKVSMPQSRWNVVKQALLEA